MACEEAPIVSVSGEISIKPFRVGLMTSDCFERTEIDLHGDEARHENSPRVRQELYFLSRPSQFVALWGCVASVCGDVMDVDSCGHNFSEIGEVEVEPFVNATGVTVAPVHLSRVLAASERFACLHADDLGLCENRSHFASYLCCLGSVQVLSAMEEDGDLVENRLVF